MLLLCVRMCVVHPAAGVLLRRCCMSMFGLVSLSVSEMGVAGADVGLLLCCWCSPCAVLVMAVHAPEMLRALHVLLLELV